MKYDQKMIKTYFKEHPEDFAYIKMISEADYGCEEHDERGPVRSYVVTVTRDGESSHEVPDDMLVKEGISEGTFISEAIYKKIFG